jgi:hypothetical protein
VHLYKIALLRIFFLVDEGAELKVGVNTQSGVHKKTTTAFLHGDFCHRPKSLQVSKFNKEAIWWNDVLIFENLFLGK